MSALFPRRPRAAALLAPLALSACATGPAQRLEVSGQLPSAGTYALVEQADPAALVTSCLAEAGFAAGSPAGVLVQVARTVRPVRSAVLRDPAAAPGRERGGARRDRDGLILAFTDPATGALLWRAEASQRLGRGEQPGAGAALAGPLCTALKSARGAGSR